MWDLQNLSKTSVCGPMLYLASGQQATGQALSSGLCAFHNSGVLTATVYQVSVVRGSPPMGTSTGQLTRKVYPVSGHGDRLTPVLTPPGVGVKHLRADRDGSHTPSTTCFSLVLLSHLAGVTKPSDRAGERLSPNIPKGRSLLCS